MHVAHDLARWRRERRPLCLAIGFFDGVHRGHARVIRAAVARAQACGGTAWVLTFEPHPARILKPDAAPRLLTPLPHKLHLIEQLGVDGCMALPFTPELAACPPSEFLDRLLDAAGSLTDVFVGPNWRFGQGRAGTPDLIRSVAGARGVNVRVVPPVRHGGEVVSSTRIRSALTHGRLAEAARLLGRPFSLLGTVVHGDRVGRTLGYPTANVHPITEVLPPLGIYAASGWVRGRWHPGVVSYGVRPTMHRGAAAPAVVELHLFDFAGNLYGRQLEVRLVRRLRPERAFDSVEALRNQIARDVQTARRVLASASPGTRKHGEQKIPLHGFRGRIIVRPKSYEGNKTGRARR